MPWIGAVVGVAGSLMSDSGSQGGQTTQNSIDPRIAKYLYGESGSGGLLNQVGNLQAQQSAQGGLNPMQTAGLELQRQTLTDPRYTQGFDQMRNLGSGMMNQGVAGNPFTGGGMVSGGTGGMGGGAPQGGPQMTIGTQPRPGMSNSLGFTPNAANSSAFQPISQQTAPPGQASVTPDDLRAWQQQQVGSMNQQIGDRFSAGDAARGYVDRGGGA